MFLLLLYVRLGVGKGVAGRGRGVPREEEVAERLWQVREMRSMKLD